MKIDASTFRLGKTIDWRDHVVGGAIGAAYVAWLLSTARTLGFARDEGFYFRAATDYARWFAILFDKPSMAMQRAVIDQSWATNHEHPALMKSLFALSWMFFHEKYKVFTDASTSFRFPGMCMAGLALWVTYLFAARAYSRRAGVVAAFALALMPRFFYNSHLACFDVPITTMWLLSIYIYWRSEQQYTAAWAIAAGVVYGLTLETKHNAWILPAVFLAHAAVIHGKRFVKQKRPCASLWNLISMATIGPLVFYALWPWIWNDTQSRVEFWFNFHTKHEFLQYRVFG